MWWIGKWNIAHLQPKHEHPCPRQPVIQLMMRMLPRGRSLWMKGMYMGSPDTVIYLRESVLWLWRVWSCLGSFHSHAPGKTFIANQDSWIQASSRSFVARLVLESDLLHGTLVIRVHFFKLRLYIIWKLTKYALHWSMDMTIFGRDICIWKSGIWGCKKSNYWENHL